MSGEGWDRKTRSLAWRAYIKGIAKNSQGEETKWRSRYGKSYSIPPRILLIKIHIKWSSPGLLLRFHLVPLCALFVMFRLYWPSSCFSTHQPLSRAWLFVHVLVCLASLHCFIQSSNTTSLTTLAKVALPIPHLLWLPSTYQFIILLNLLVYFPVSLKLL